MSRLVAIAIVLAASLTGAVVFAADRMPCGCSKAGAAQAEEPNLAVTDGRKKPGESFVCPVDAAPGKVAASTPSTEYRGQTYYFCSLEEKKRFLEAPDRFSAIE